MNFDAACCGSLTTFGLSLASCLEQHAPTCLDTSGSFPPPVSSDPHTHTLSLSLLPYTDHSLTPALPALNSRRSIHHRRRIRHQSLRGLRHSWRRRRRRQQQRHAHNICGRHDQRRLERRGRFVVSDNDSCGRRRQFFCQFGGRGFAVRERVGQERRAQDRCGLEGLHHGRARRRPRCSGLVKCIYVCVCMLCTYVCTKVPTYIPGVCMYTQACMRWGARTGRGTVVGERCGWRMPHTCSLFCNNCQMVFVLFQIWKAVTSPCVMI